MIVEPNFETVPPQCISKSLTSDNFPAISLLVFYQSSLLFLFTYPIWKSSVEDGERSETMAIIMGYIKKCRLLTIITAGTGESYIRYVRLS